MTTKVSLQDIKQLLQYDEEPKLIELVDNILGFAIVMSPIALGPGALPILGLLGPKNELTRLLRALYSKLTSKDTPSYLERHNRLLIAYGLLPYSAFLSALDELQPVLAETLGLPEGTELSAFQIPTGDYEADAGATPATSITDETATTFIHLPHPLDGVAGQERQTMPLFQDLAHGYSRLLILQPFWKESSDQCQREALAAIAKLPAGALVHFHAQYLDLARESEDFYVWSALHEQQSTRAAVDHLSEYVKAYVELETGAETAADLGFAELSEAIRLLPYHAAEHPAQQIIADLHRMYEAQLEAPIIDDSSPHESPTQSLVFPKKSQIFIPQSFKATRHDSANTHLENEETWSALESRQGLGAFLLRSLTSPYSTETPILILGHPGSGKSLLTEVLAARFVCPYFHPVRVKLRDVNPEAQIQAQIEQQIQIDTGREAHWPDLANEFGDHPPLLILDGYDELLQTRGRVFSDYLQLVREFQRREAIQGRPVRVLITSRITLIDKADIPLGSTIIRLDDFDTARQNRWISIWNSSNRSYFARSEIQEFELPDQTRILALAKQPLLLQMLAIYDSEANSLRSSHGMDQTVLYNSLLIRFIQRERNKGINGSDFTRSAADTKASIVDDDIRRLGVAAVGMYNRRSLHILGSQLDEDLQYFNLIQDRPETTGRSLTRAELLLGSFFFVHESRTIGFSRGATVLGASAFEFLHNTFGEFLAADFILREVIREVDVIGKLRGSPAPRGPMDQRLDSADGLPTSWFACLIYTPLYSRPVILEMLQEWCWHRLSAPGQDVSEFFVNLDLIVSSHLRRIIEGSGLPSIFSDAKASPFPSSPTLGHVAIYSLNLITLRAVLDKSGYNFDERLFRLHESAPRPWDQLSHLWRSWFSLESLEGLAAVVEAQREDHLVRVCPRLPFRIPGSVDCLDRVLAVATALSDDVVSGLAGFCAYEGGGAGSTDLSFVESRLAREGIEVRLKLLVQYWRSRLPLASVLDASEIEALTDLIALAVREFPRFPVTALEALRLAGELDLRMLDHGRVRSEHRQILLALRRLYRLDDIPAEFSGLLGALIGLFAKLSPPDSMWFEEVMSALDVAREDVRPEVFADLIIATVEQPLSRMYALRAFELVEPSDLLSQLVSRRPGKVVQLLWATNNTPIGRILRSHAERILRGDLLRSVWSRDRNAALELLALVKGVDSRISEVVSGPELREIVADGCCREIVARRPGFGVELFRLACMAGTERVQGEVAEFMVRALEFGSRGWGTAEGIVRLIRIARDLPSGSAVRSRLVELVHGAVVGSGPLLALRPLDDSVDRWQVEEGGECLTLLDLDTLPLRYFEDLRWLARTADDSKLGVVLARYAGS